MTGAELIAAERDRQITEEGYALKHDDRYLKNELLLAASCYLTRVIFPRETRPGRIPKMWPWAKEFWKPATPTRMLVKAGALIAAEIDRLQRANEHV